MIGGVLADNEEGGLGAMIRQRLQDGRRVLPGHGTVIKGQQHFVGTQEVVLLEMLEAKAARPPVVSISPDTRNAESILVVAFYAVAL